MNFLLLFLLVLNSDFAKRDSGFVFSVSYSPKANESTFRRNDDQSSKTYVGNKFKATSGYKFSYFSLLGNLVYADMEFKSESTQKRIDTNYGVTFRFTPIKYFYIQSTYWITNTELSYSARSDEKFSGEKITAGAGIRIPTPQGPYFTVSGTYILSSKMRKKGASDANVVDEEGYTIAVGGTLSFSN